MKILLLLAIASASLLAQPVVKQPCRTGVTTNCTPQADANGDVNIGTTALNPTTGIKGPIIACVGAPGNTTGPYGSLCEVRATGALWACTNASGCTVSGDWTAAGGGGVTSFNSRAGAVIPATSDYSFAQISGAATNAQMPSGVCVRTSYTIPYTDSVFIVASGTATKTLLTLSNQALCSVRINVPTVAYAGTSITAVTCSVGTSTGGNSAIYLSPLSVMQTTNSLAQGGDFVGTDLFSADSAAGVLLTCAATGANFGNGATTVLTAGSFKVTVGTYVIP